MNFVNLTTHIVRLNDGRVYQPSGVVARIASNYTDADANGIADVVFGDIQGLPDQLPDTTYIVSGQFAAAVKGRRDDVASPATGHKDCVRVDGQVYSVPFFVRA